jgi:hypothetical protein
MKEQEDVQVYETFEEIEEIVTPSSMGTIFCCKG